MLKKILTISLVICGAAVYLHAQTPATQPAQQTHVTEGGVKCTTTDAGDWVTEKGDTVYVHYTGKLPSGEQFDSSIGKEPINIVLGAGRVIKGWEEGLLGMKLGEKRHLVIPPGVAYGERGAGGGKIPPNATLEFDVQIVGVIRGAR